MDITLSFYMDEFWFQKFFAALSLLYYNPEVDGDGQFWQIRVFISESESTVAASSC